MSLVSPSPRSPPPSRRDQLLASLRALTFNDDIDPELFAFGGASLEIGVVADQQQSHCATPSPNRDECVDASQACVFPEKQVNTDPALSTRLAFSHNFSADQCDGWLVDLEDTNAYNSNDFFLLDLLFSNENAAYTTPHNIENSNGSNSQHFVSASCSWDTPADHSGSQPLYSDNNNRGISSISSSEDWASSSNKDIENKKSQQNLEAGGFAGDSIHSLLAEERSRQAGKRSWVQASSADPQARQHSNSNNGSSTHSPQKRHRKHYVVEKRYRAGLNERFDALRDCLETWKKPRSPPQQVSTPSPNGSQAGEGNNSDGIGKMGKAEVLMEAVTYLREIQEENDVLLEHVKLLVRRLRATKQALQEDDPMMRLAARAA